MSFQQSHILLKLVPGDVKEGDLYRTWMVSCVMSYLWNCSRPIVQLNCWGIIPKTQYNKTLGLRGQPFMIWGLQRKFEMIFPPREPLPHKFFTQKGKWIHLGRLTFPKFPNFEPHYSLPYKELNARYPVHLACGNIIWIFEQKFLSNHANFIF